MIQGIIPTQKFELIRDRIVYILQTEYASQKALCDAHDPVIPFTVPAIYNERRGQVDFQEDEVIIVKLGRAVYSNEDGECAMGTYTFYIDVFGYDQSESDTTDAFEGWYLSAKKLHKNFGIIRAILRDKDYLQLGWSNDTTINIASTRIESFIPEVRSDGEDTNSETYGRMFFEVDAYEYVEDKTYTPIGDVLLQMAIDGGNDGHIIIGDADGILIKNEDDVPLSNEQEQLLITDNN